MRPGSFDVSSYRSLDEPNTDGSYICEGGGERGGNMSRRIRGRLWTIENLGVGAEKGVLG